MLKNKMYAQNLNKNVIFFDVMLILFPLLAYESYHKTHCFCDNFRKLITEKLLTRRVANYEIGCVNANSAMQFEEGPRLGVFDKVKFIK